MKRIIIVEDDPDILETMTIILTNAGQSVTGYSNGEAILANDFTLPDIFIIDKQLPGVDGLDVCKYLKSRGETKDIAVVMVSASPHIQLLAKAALADDAIEKPFNITDLRNIVVKHLKK